MWRHVTTGEKPDVGTLSLQQASLQPCDVIALLLATPSNSCCCYRIIIAERHVISVKDRRLGFERLEILHPLFIQCKSFDIIPPHMLIAKIGTVPYFALLVERRRCEFMLLLTLKCQRSQVSSNTILLWHWANRIPWLYCYILCLLFLIHLF